MSKRKVSVEDKTYAVNLYLDRKESQRRIADMFDVSLASVQQWIRNYESMGANAFTLKGNKKYSKELKQQAVLDYLAGYGSQNDICKKYGIRSKGKLQTWIKKYNGHEELKSFGTGGSIVMTKGRKTTFEERVEIVQYCIAHDRNYAQTAEQYHVSYQQARNYIVKYEAGGVEALRDNRGKRKRPDEIHYYIGMEKHKVYLSAILDLYDRRIVSYVIRDKNNNALVFDTVDNALLRNPGAQPLFHSDRGFQYTNRTFHTKLVNAGITQSMSRVAKCIDNGPMEKHEIYLQAA